MFDPWPSVSVQHHMQSTSTSQTLLPSLFGTIAIWCAWSQPAGTYDTQKCGPSRHPLSSGAVCRSFRECSNRILREKGSAIKAFALGLMSCSAAFIPLLLRGSEPIILDHTDLARYHALSRRSFLDSFHDCLSFSSLLICSVCRSAKASSQTTGDTMCLHGTHKSSAPQHRTGPPGHLQAASLRSTSYDGAVDEVKLAALASGGKCKGQIRSSAMRGSGAAFESLIKGKLVPRGLLPRSNRVLITWCAPSN